MGEAKRAGVLVAFIALVAGGLAPAALGQTREYLFRKIADTNTPVPGGTGTYTGFGTPTSNSFTADFAGGSGLFGFQWTSTGPSKPLAFSRLADTTTPVPGGSGTFTSFAGLGLGDVFRGVGSDGQDGIYTVNRTTRAVSLIADRNTPIPGGTGTFTGFGSGPQGTTFFGQGSDGQQGVYSRIGQTLRKVADKNTVAPGAGGATFSAFSPAVGAQTFLANVNGRRGAYFGDGSTLRTVVDYQTPMGDSASGASVFRFNRNANVDARVFRIDYDVSFKALVKLSPYWPTLDLIAFTAQPAPGRSAWFADFTAMGFAWGTPEDGNETYFRAVNSDDSVGIYSSRELQPLQAVIDTSMTLDGKRVVALGMGDESVEGYSVTFRADFADGSSGIYQAYTLTPEPGAVALGIVLGAIGAMRRRPRRTA